MNSQEFGLTGKSIDQVVAEIQVEVAERRAKGDYPVGLEQQLEAFFDGMMRDLHERDLVTAELEEAFLRLNHLVRQFSVDVSSESQLPGLSVVHRTFARLIRRHTQNIATQVVQIGDAILESVHEVLELSKRIYEHDDRQIGRTLMAVQDQLAVIEHLSLLTVDIEARLRALEARDG